MNPFRAIISCPVLRAALCAASLVMGCVQADAQIDFSGSNKYRYNQREQVEGPPRSRNRERSDNDESSSNTKESERVAKVNGMVTDARAVAERDPREALRLSREALKLARDAKFKKELENLIRWLEGAVMIKDGDTTYDTGDRAGALVFYRRAMAAHPNVFSEEGKRFVAKLEIEEKTRKEDELREAKEEKERVKRETEDLKIATKLRTRVTAFAASLDTDPPKIGEVILGFYGDPTAYNDALSEQAGRGFDNYGRLKGSRPIASDIVPKVTASEVLPVTIPDKYRNNPKIAALKKEWEEAKTEQVAAGAQLEQIKVMREKHAAKKEDLDVMEVNARYSWDAAQSKKDTAAVKVTETLRTFKEAPVD